MSAPKNSDRMWMVVRGALLASPIVVSSIASAGVILPPSLVPGKEYSNHMDETAGGLADFLQNIAWDGLGGAVDTFDYSGSGRPILPGGDPEPMDPDMVDALANNNDFLFDPVRMSAVPFVVSFGGIGDIYFHDTAGATGIWALGPVDINAGSPPDDVDGLELWGSPDMDDADRFSIIGDSLGGGTAIFTYVPGAHNSSPYLTHAALAAAIGVGHTVDIDALMVADRDGDGVWSAPDSIIFSLWPDATHDGGEIWTWDFGGLPSFLVHGGTVWDTANPVGATFGVATENINAFEAIPAPGTLALLGLGGLFLRRRRRA